jgi:hypothetical protein
VGLMLTVASWVSSELTAARAQGGGGDNADGWIMVASELNQNDGFVYMFNTRREVLLIYAFYSRTAQRGTSRFTNAELEFLAGRLCKWDALYTQLQPYPPRAATTRGPTHTPSQIKDAFEKLNQP